MENCVGRFRDYLEPGSDPEDDPKGPASVPTPIRAWLTPRANGLPEGYDLSSPEGSQGAWSLVIEDGERNDSFDGEFDELVALARGRALQYFVWSVSRQTHRAFTPQDVRVVD